MVLKNVSLERIAVVVGKVVAPIAINAVEALKVAAKRLWDDLIPMAMVKSAKLNAKESANISEMVEDLLEVAAEETRVPEMAVGQTALLEIIVAEATVGAEDNLYN